MAAQQVIKTARKAKARATVDALTLALETYKNDMGVYPPDESSKMVMNHLTGFKESPSEMSADFKKEPDWNGPYYEAKKKEFKAGNGVAEPKFISSAVSKQRHH